MRIGLHLGAALVLTGLCVPLGAQQADRAQAETLSQRAATRLRALHAEADRLTSQERTLLGELRRLEVERQIRTEELNQAQRDLASVTAQISTLDQQITGLEQQDRAEMPALRARVISLYKLGGGSYARLLLSTAHLRDLGEASRMVAAIARQDRDRMAAHQQRIAELTASRAALEVQRGKLAALRTEATRAQAANEAAVAGRSALVKEIDSRRDLNAQLSGELQSAQRKLQSTLATLATTGAASSPSLPIGPFRGDLEWPVSGQIRQRFGASRPGRAAPSNGIDIAAAEGSPVKVVHDGTVAFADVFSGFGRLVIVDHGNQTFSLYGNLETLSVTEGARLQHGEAVGTVGVAPTGAAGLYFELRVDGRPVDPVEWLRQR